MVMTRDQAGVAVQAAVAERDAIQANLLELDSSFGKQLLAGAELTGDTRRRWEATAATLATLWQVFSAYSAVVDQAAEAAARHLGPRELTALTELLTGRSVHLASGPAPLAGRDLADSGREDLTLATAVARMRGAFSTVTEVVSAAEMVWNEVAGRLDAAGAELARVAQASAGLGDEALAADLAAAQGQLARLRDTLNSDPLALWRGQRGPHGGTVDTSAADRLAGQAAAVAARAAELARLRDGARQRIAAVTTAAADARSAHDDAVAAWQRTAAKIAPGALPPPPADLADLSARLAGLGPLLDSGRLTRLGSELELLDRELATATANFKEAERAVVAALAKRDELRGLLGAYRAKAARLGAVEDAVLAERYERARDLLWTAPCDLAAAEAAVAGYQQAVLGQRGG